MSQTLLEYVIETEYGPPEKRSGSRSFWLCPFHSESNASFSTLPVKAGKKDRFKCFACGAWGDEFDILKRFHPNENWTQRKIRFQKLRIEFEFNLAAENNSKPLFSFRGSGTSPDREFARESSDAMTGLKQLLNEFGNPSDELIEFLSKIQSVSRETRTPEGDLLLMLIDTLNFTKSSGDVPEGEFDEWTEEQKFDWYLNRTANRAARLLAEPWRFTYA